MPENIFVNRETLYTGERKYAPLFGDGNNNNNNNINTYATSLHTTGYAINVHMHVRRDKSKYWFSLAESYIVPATCVFIYILSTIYNNIIVWRERISNIPTYGNRSNEFFGTRKCTTKTQINTKKN